MDFSSPEMQRRLIHTKVYYNFALSEKKQSLLSSACIILKKPSRGVLRKRCSENTQQIYRRNTHAEVWFKYCCWNFIEITLQDGCSPVNLLHMFRTSFLQNTSRRLPLIFVQLASMNVLYSMWHYFWYKFIVTLIFFQWPCCCVLWNKCFGRSPQFKSVFYTTAVCCWHQRCKKLSYFILVTFPQLILFLITFFVFFHFVNAHFCL